MIHNAIELALNLGVTVFATAAVVVFTIIVIATYLKGS